MKSKLDLKHSNTKPHYLFGQNTANKCTTHQKLFQIKVWDKNSLKRIMTLLDKEKISVQKLYSTANQNNIVMNR